MLSNLILHLDMDGVLSDFDSAFKQLSGGLTGEEYRNVHGRKAETNMFLSQGVPFWANMQWLEGGRELLDFGLKHFGVVRILSSAGTGKDWVKFKDVQIGKMTWLATHAPQIQKRNIIIVPFSTLKSRHAGPDRILVDDHPDNIKRWNAKGGIGIEHVHADWPRSIELLKQYANVTSGDSLKLKEIVDSL